MGASAAPGVVLIDKPGGMTSHDVVARTRRAMGTRRVGHAGTLDPMATGLLVLGVEGATRLLTFVVGLDKTYLATIRLGAATDTDDAEGQPTERADARTVAAIDDDRVDREVAALTGRIDQVPSTVSAIKVEGRRAYDLAREGKEVTLKSRTVDVTRFDVVARRHGDGVYDLDVVVDCSSGTYIRALARDLGRALGVGGHLTALRRTRIGPFSVDDASTVDALEPGASTVSLLSPAAAAGAVLPVLVVREDEALALRQGKRLIGAAGRLPGERAAAVDPDGALIGIVEARGADVKSLMNMAEGS